MRQVKFRYWNGSKVLNQEAIINHLNKYIARNDKHLMQFTGLFDKQGVEIYEGDLFIDDHNEEIGEAVFNDGAYWVDWSNPVLLSEINACYFVTGNIHEHPHLMEEQQ